MPKAFRQGDHICTLFDTEEEQLAVAAAYLADGLRQNERCYYVGRSRAALVRFRDALGDAGIHVGDALRRGALIEATSNDAHLAGGSFDSERMLRMLNEAVEAALNDGFTGLRTCGDMSWLLLEPSGAHQVVEYETLLNQFFSSVRAAGMCQDHRRRLPRELIASSLATHSSAVVSGQHKSNPFYQSPASR